MRMMGMLSRVAAIAVAALVFQAANALAAENPMYLFIKTADGMSFDGKSLTLTGVADNVVWFTDRPNHEAGEVSLDKFVEGWPESMTADSPNVVLAIEGSDGGPPVVEVSNPRREGSNVIYDAVVIHGTVPETGGRTTVVVDAFCGACPFCDWTKC